MSLRPQRLRLLLLAALVIASAGWLVWLQMRQRQHADAFSTNPPSQAIPPAQASLALPKEPLPGELILRDYGLPSTGLEDDLAMVAHALGNLALLVKGDSPFRLGANEEFAAALRGINAAQIRFLPDDHSAFNDKGQITDRWQTPLFFHALSAQRIDVRSAGPDRQMWSSDDLHRRYDGQLLKGESLNPTSLFDDRSLQPGRR